MTRARPRGPNSSMPISAPLASSTGPPSKRPPALTARLMRRSMVPPRMERQAGPISPTEPDTASAEPWLLPMGGETCRHGCCRSSDIGDGLGKGAQVEVAHFGLLGFLHAPDIARQPARRYSPDG